MNMSLDLSSIKSLSSVNLEDSIISEKKSIKKSSSKIIVEKLIKNHKKKNNKLQEIYRNTGKKIFQSKTKTTKDNTSSLMSQSSLSNNNYEKYINKRNTDASPEELKKKVNKEKEEDMIFIKQV